MTYGQLFGIQGPSTEVWMTEVTLQGNGDGERDCDDCSLRVFTEAAVYAEGARLVRR